MANKKVNILIVEDEKTLSDMYYDKFKTEGYDVEVVFSAEEALEFVRKKKPKLILLDMLLPRKSGIGFLEDVRSSNIVAGVNIVVFSNFDDPETKGRALKLGVQDYLLKTQYTPQELLDQVRKYLE